jgi:hypothetical protein
MAVLRIDKRQRSKLKQLLHKTAELSGSHTTLQASSSSTLLDDDSHRSGGGSGGGGLDDDEEYPPYCMFEFTV